MKKLHVCLIAFAILSCSYPAVASQWRYCYVQVPSGDSTTVYISNSLSSRTEFYNNTVEKAFTDFLNTKYNLDISSVSCSNPTELDDEIHEINAAKKEWRELDYRVVGTGWSFN